MQLLGINQFPIVKTNTGNTVLLVLFRNILFPLFILLVSSSLFCISRCTVGSILKKKIYYK